MIYRVLDRPLRLFFWPLLLSTLFLARVAGASEVSKGTPDASDNCPAVAELVNQDRDIGPAIQSCLDQTRPGNTINLPAGKYTLRTRIKITKSVTIGPQGLPTSSGNPCVATGDQRCVTILVDMLVNNNDPESDRIMPIEIVANDVTIHHVIFHGSRGENISNDRNICQDNKTRRLGGGIQEEGSHFFIHDSVLEYFTCATSLEIRVNVSDVKIENNFIGYNGDHIHKNMWSDGVTIHDAIGALVTGNTFIDNTDVQLIFGGCRNCTITHNDLHHTTNPSGGSFADLMLHAWPKTSGNYDGTIVSDNKIDCGPAKQCGIGLMIGPDLWYKAPTFGGTVSHNTIQNAKLGIAIDNLSGTMTVVDNSVSNSGGREMSTCGERNTPGIDVAPPSRRFVNVDAIASNDTDAASTEFAGCIMNYELYPY